MLTGQPATHGWSGHSRQRSASRSAFLDAIAAVDFGEVFRAHPRVLLAHRRAFLRNGSNGLLGHVADPLSAGHFFERIVQLEQVHRRIDRVCHRLHAAVLRPALDRRALVLHVAPQP